MEVGLAVRWVLTRDLLMPEDVRTDAEGSSLLLAAEAVSHARAKGNESRVSSLHLLHAILFTVLV